MTAQVIINSLEFARKSLEVHGKIPYSQLSRLHDLLSSDEGELDYHLQGSIDTEGVPVLRLQLNGRLSLACQRCLGPMEYALDCHVNYILVPSEEMLPATEDERDDADCLVADQQMQVLRLVEDEVLLELPLAPKHEYIDCAGIATDYATHKENPFRILQGLKQK